MLKKVLVAAALGGSLVVTALLGSSRAQPTVLIGPYPARVVGNADPLVRHRLEVQIPVAGNETVWAQASIPYGSSETPPLGSWVWVEFEGGNPGAPVWIGWRP